MLICKFHVQKHPIQFKSPTKPILRESWCSNFTPIAANLSAKSIIKTDPKNSDYAVEPGPPNRNFEPWQGLGLGERMWR
ncbi:hypothetical protein ACFXTO_036295 [Malus domestica]